MGLLLELGSSAITAKDLSLVEDILLCIATALMGAHVHSMDNAAELTSHTLFLHNKSLKLPPAFILSTILSSDVAVLKTTNAIQVRNRFDTDRSPI